MITSVISEFPDDDVGEGWLAVSEDASEELSWVVEDSCVALSVSPD